MIDLTEDQGLSVLAIAGGVGLRPDVEELELAMIRVRERPDLVLDLLRSVLEPEPLSRVTACSYRHPNGFAKIVLHDAGTNGTSVRLHVWPASTNASSEALAARRDSAPHGHRWNFASALVAGNGLLVEDFAVEDVEEPDEGEVPTEAPDLVLWDKLVFEPAVTTTPSLVGRAHLVSREYWVRDPVKDIYWCDVDQIHTIGPIDSAMTATLVLQGSEIRTTAPVFRRPDGPPDPGRSALDETEVARLIGLVIAAMEGTTGREEARHDEPNRTSSAIRFRPLSTNLEASGRTTL